MICCPLDKMAQIIFGSMIRYIYGKDRSAPKKQFCYRLTASLPIRYKGGDFKKGRYAYE